MIFRVDNTFLVNLTRHETNLVIGGFSRSDHYYPVRSLSASCFRTVLMNIINAIKTGDVKRAPRFEAMLVNVETNKQRERLRPPEATIGLLSPAAKTAAPSRQRYCRP